MRESRVYDGRVTRGRVIPTLAAWPQHTGDRGHGQEWLMPVWRSGDGGVGEDTRGVDNGSWAVITDWPRVVYSRALTAVITV